MPTLILSPTYNYESKTLRKAAQTLGWSTFRFQGDSLPSSYDEEDTVDHAIYCTVPNAFVVANQLSSFLLGCSCDWLPELPDEFLRRKIILRKLRDAKSDTERRFVKPALGKSFVAGVTTGDRLSSVTPHLPANLLVHVSEVVQWEIEYRCFIADQSVVTMSPYRRGEAFFSDYKRPLNALRGEQEEALEFASSVIQTVPCPRAFVLDVGKIKGRGWAVVEPNECWGSGIYGCEPLKVLDVLLASTVLRTAATEDDLFWDYSKHYYRACPNMIS